VTILDPACGGSGCYDGRDAVFAGYQRGVRRESAAVGDDCDDRVEERRPGWRGHSGDQDISWFDAVEVLCSANDTGGSGGDTRAGRLTGEDVVLLVGSADPEGVLQVAADQRWSGAEDERWDQVALTLPAALALPSGWPERLDLGDLGPGEEVQLVGLVGDTGGVRVSPRRLAQARRSGQPRVS